MIVRRSTSTNLGKTISEPPFGVELDELSTVIHFMTGRYSKTFSVTMDTKNSAQQTKMSRNLFAIVVLYIFQFTKSICNVLAGFDA